MSVANSTVEAAIESVLATVVGTTKVHWALVNPMYEPPPKQTYVKAWIVRQTEAPFMLGSTAAVGLAYFQVMHDVENPAAVNAAAVLAQSIKDAFPIGLYPNSQPFRVTKAYRETPVVMLPWRAEPVVVEFVSYSS